MHDRRRIRALYAAGLGPTEISRVIGCSRSAVYRAIAPDASLTYRRRPRYADAIARVEAVVAQYPRMPSTAVAHQVHWPGSLRQLQNVCHPLRTPALEAARARGVTVRPALSLAV